MTLTLPEPVRWGADGASLLVLDQTRLPTEEVVRELATLEAVAEAISTLRVRGAPLIGIVAAMGVAAELRRRALSGSAVQPDEVDAWCDALAATRPTAVNLVWALNRMRSVARAQPGPSVDALADALHAEAQAIWDEDAAMCRRIGDHGAALLRDGARVLTHCNAGALATGGMGTALAPIYVAHERGWRVSVFADETRPLLQGSRLTAWELHRAGIDVTVLPDNAAASLFATDPPDVVLVGADRIAANGDVANKVGTLGVARLARAYGGPFYVLAPSSTVDPDTATGADIPIEHRGRDEVARGLGAVTMPEGVPAYTPAFDVTPAELITGIVTEGGIHTPGGVLGGERGSERRANPAVALTRPDPAAALVQAARALARSGLIAGGAGNLSARLDAGRMLITRRGVAKGELRPQDLVAVPLEGEPDARASTELPFHRACYAARADVGAVVHAHPPALVAAAARGLEPEVLLPELTLGTGSIARVPLLPSGSRELAEAVGRAAAEGAGVVILERHGAVGLGRDPAEAVRRLELAELGAYTALLAEGEVPSEGEVPPEGETAASLRRRIDALLGSTASGS